MKGETSNFTVKLYGEKLKRIKIAITCLLDLGNLPRRCPFKSNIRTCLSSCGIAIRPFDDTDKRFTALSNLIVAKEALILRISHILTVLSSDPDTSFSSLVKTALVMLL